LQFELTQFDGTNLIACVGSQSYNCGILPTTNTLLPEIVLVVMAKVTGTSAVSGKTRVAAMSKAAHATHPALSILTIETARMLPENYRIHKERMTPIRESASFSIAATQKRPTIRR
jgi:hypothetical protein